MRRYRTFRAIVTICLVLLALSSPVRAEGAPGTASDAVKAFQAELLAVMKNAKALGLRGRYEKLEPAVQKAFDLPFMTKLSIGPSWGRLTPEQKASATRAYGRYVAATYATRFDGFSGEQWPVLNETKIKHGWLVRTQIVRPNDAPVSINYILHDNDEAWQIRDLYLGGAISELATRRSEFTGILRNQGVDGLIAVLNKKADELTG
jgi:phospholipid transport system substrate-binding protein